MKRLGLVDRTLASGIRVVHVQTGPSCLFDITTHFSVGARDEVPAQNGMTHLLEHMMYRGSGPYKTSTSFARQLESINGESNAYTSAEMTEFWFQCDVSRYREGLELLGLFLSEPAFESFDLEKRIIIKELDEDYNESGHLIDVHSLAMGGHFGKAGLGLPVGGTAEGITAITLDNLRAHRSSFYRPNSLLVSIRSALDPAEVFEACEALLGPWARTARRMEPGSPSVAGRAFTSRQVAPQKRLPGPSRIGVDNVDNQYALRFSFAMPCGDVRLLRAIDLASRILDDGMSSRLQRSVREEKGLVYDISGYVEDYSDHIICTIEATADGDHLAETAATITSELADLCGKGPTAEEHEHALGRARFELAKLEEHHHDFLERYVEGAFYERPFALEAEDTQMRSTGRAEVQAAAQALFRPAHLVTVLVGPDAPNLIGKLTTL